MGMRKILDRTFAVNICANARMKATSAQPGHPAAHACDRDNGTYWMPAEGTAAPSLEWTFSAEKSFDCLLLQERITVGQRIEKFRLEAWSGSAWKEIVRGTTVGYKRLIRFPAVKAGRVRLVIDGSRTSPTLSTVGLFKTP
jgi:alpha-L-fucosidase